MNEALGLALSDLNDIVKSTESREDCKDIASQIHASVASITSIQKLFETFIEGANFMSRYARQQ